jgi:hypothetical protein
MEKQNADELITRDLAFRFALFAFFTAFSLFLVFNKIQCCESGSCRIDIILTDPDLNPYSFQPNVKLNYRYFLRNLNILSKIFKSLPPLTLTRNIKNCKPALMGIKVKTPTCIKLGVGFGIRIWIWIWIGIKIGSRCGSGSATKRCLFITLKKLCKLDPIMYAIRTYQVDNY